MSKKTTPPKDLVNIDDGKRFERKPSKDVPKDIAKLVEDAYRNVLRQNKGK